MTDVTRREFIGGMSMAAACAAFGGAAAERPQPAVLPSKSHLEWADQEIGMFFHFDIPVFKPRWRWRTFKNLPGPELYNPAKLDIEQWMAAAEAIGAKYVVFVAKHCSGFLQWQSDLYPYGLKQAPWRGGKGDLVREFTDAARRHGLKPGLYASTTANSFLGADNPGRVKAKGWLGAPSPETQKRYAKICEGMAEELWSRYGELFEIWFDGGALAPSAGGPDLIPILEKHQPDAILFGGPKDAKNLIRWVGNERGVAPYPCWSTNGRPTQDDGTKEFRYPGHPDGKVWCPGECDVPLKPGCWFSTDRGRYWTPDELMTMYLHSVGRNCNLLLNCAPMPDGSVSEEDMKRYAAFGKAIRARYAHPLGRAEGDGATIELPLAKDAGPAGQVVLAERLQYGERVREFGIEAFDGGKWTKVYSGSCIGHKHIACFPPVRAARLRLSVGKAAGRPAIREFSAWRVS